MSYRIEELLIVTIADLLRERSHVAVGAASPIPGAGALLARERSPALRVSVLGSERHNTFTDGGRELFDCAAQGRIDGFFSAVRRSMVVQISILWGSETIPPSRLGFQDLSVPLTYIFWSPM